MRNGGSAQSVKIKAADPIAKRAILWDIHKSWGSAAILLQRATMPLLFSVIRYQMPEP
jgi:hypothetical protein